MYRKLIPIIAFVLLAAALAVVSALYHGSEKRNKSQQKHIVSLETQISEQTVIIDSLLKRKTYSFDVRLSVTDRSRNIVYGKYNKGSISVPQDKTYQLKIDSTSVYIK